MPLYERLAHTQEPFITLHEFASFVGEILAGNFDVAGAAAKFGLDAGEQAELTTLLGKLTEPPEFYPLGGLVTLTNVGAAYDGIAAAKGLGFVGVNVEGITEVIFRVRYNKVGTGTLSWQLWNETEGQEVGVINDAAAAGDNKDQSVTVTPGAPLTGGVKLLRPRVKSTVAADDPVYYGSCLLVRRARRPTSFGLHELLMLLHHGNYTVAGFKARLGVT
jgi:hypothetical protein